MKPLKRLLLNMRRRQISGVSAFGHGFAEGSRAKNKNYGMQPNQSYIAKLLQMQCYVGRRPHRCALPLSGVVPLLTSFTKLNFQPSVQGAMAHNVGIYATAIANGLKTNK